jgi:hypothetical protein
VNRDDVLRLAQEAGFELDCCSLEWHDRIQRFAELVATVERLACARICYSAAPSDGTVSTELELARAIRARSKA